MYKKLKTLSAFITSLALLINLVPGFALAQSISPTTLPLVQSADMVYLGKFTYPLDDGAGGNLTYGYKTLGMGADGVSLYVGCIYGPVARISIPAIGGVAKVLEPCQKPANIGAINPGDTNGIYMGGALAWQGKLISSAYAYYDGGGTAKGSHFTGTTIANSSGPYSVGTMNPGFTGGNMGPIPQEWRSLLGGPAFTSQWALSIISRTSSGPSFTVFDPAQVGVVNPVPATMLIGYPLSNTNPAVGYYGNTTSANPVYDMGSGPGGVAFPDGTRSVLFIQRVGTTPACYGEGTTNPALDRQPVPGYNGAVIYCYDLANQYKGGHQYPYKHQVAAYDANDLVAVKNGTKKPWDVVPYTRWYLTDINNTGSADIRSATYDPATKKIYITNENGGGTPEVHVYQIRIGTTPAADTTSPSVSVTAPTTGSTVSGASVAVSANATDNVAVAGVQFKLDGANLGAEDATAPYSMTWDTRTVSAGSHTITAVARDTSGNIATASNVSVTVSNTTVQTPTADIKVNGGDTAVTVNAGTAVSLSWSSTNSTSCSVTPGSYSGTSGTQSVTPTVSTTYSFSCSGAGGSASDSVSINVNTTTTTGGTINVSTVAELKTAVSNLQSNQTIVIANGTYNITDALYLPQNISNVTIKGSGRDTTIIQGNGMTGTVNFGFWMDNVKGVTISDMTIRNISQHGVIANSGVDNPTFRNLRITDIGDQFLKNNPTSGQGVDNGILENSILEYTTYAPDTYTNGLDVHFGKNWIVRGNTFRNFRSNSGLVGPAVLMWNGSSDTIVERNTFINNHRDISLGLDNTRTAQAPVSNGALTDHARGVIANNFIYRAGGQSFFDVPIAVFDSPGTKVYNNTVYSSGLYPNAVEYRFARTTGVDIKNNLTDGAFTARDGASATLGGNNSSAVASMFVSPTTGDLHLTTSATSAIDKGVSVALTNDYDNGSRPINNLYDIGADETQSSGTVTDTTKPTVNITAPTSYTAIKGVPILVTADATDNVGVSGVQFKLDGANLGTEDTTSAYSTLWDTSSASEGAHTLTAVARDAAGNTQTSASVTVTISVPDVGDTTKPTVNITAPDYNSEANSTISLSADAYDDVGVAGVQFKVDGVNVLSEDNVEPYSVSWNTSSVPNGSHSITAVARDLAGNTQESSVVLVRVQNDTVTIVPPTATLTSPASGTSLSGSVSVSASATDDKGVAGVQFKLDGVNLLPEDTTSPYSISWNTTTASNGTHVVTATAKDVEGNQTTSAGISVSVNNSSPVPPPPTSLKVGDKVKTTTTVSVRSSAGGRYLGSQRTGKTGTITAGPGYANSLTWWKVNFTSGADGWVAANYLTKATVAMTEDDYRQNIANIYLIIKYLQERIAGQN